MQISTNKGTFAVRYAYMKDEVETLVIRDPENQQPFTGTYGDEIPNQPEYLKKYAVKEIKAKNNG